MKKPYKLVKKQVKKIIKNAEQAAQQQGREICGLLVNNGYFLEILQTKNMSERSGSFQFDSNEIEHLQEALRLLDHEIIGTFHSHPVGIAKPGDSDVEDAFEDEIILIIDVLEKKIGLWQVHNKSLKELTVEQI